MPVSEITPTPDASVASDVGHSGGRTLTTLGPDRVIASPVILRTDQLYYWSAAWQAGEAQSRADIVNGDTMTFTDPKAAMRWLFGADVD